MYKNMINNDESKIKENNSMAVRRIVAAIIVFLIPTLINSVMNFLENITGSEYNYKGCLTEIDNIDYFIELYEQEEELKDKIEKENTLNTYNSLQVKESELIKDNISRTTGGDGIFLGKKYNLTKSQLNVIAKICQAEQGNSKGSAWEAALMANRYELYGKKYGSLYSYVLTSRWWGPANTGSYTKQKLKTANLNAVRSVLVDGHRPIPLYIIEHDWTGDLTKLVTNGKTTYNFKNLNAYVKDKTVIYNKYGAKYIYYGHPTKTSDAFGYTSSAKKKVQKMQSTS